MKYRIKQVGDKFYPQYKYNFWIPIGPWEYVMKEVYKGRIIKVKHVFHSLDDANEFIENNNRNKRRD